MTKKDKTEENDLESKKEEMEETDAEIMEDNSAGDKPAKEEKSSDTKTAEDKPSLVKPAIDDKPDYYNQLLVLKADFENYRKRMEKERPGLIKWGKAEILLKLLPLYDLLLKAHLHVSDVKTDDENKEVKDIVVGLEMIFKEFKKVFEGENIREIDVLDKPYDPMKCDIMGTVDGDDENDGMVVEELQKGFYMDDKVLRPSCVKIAKKKCEAKNEDLNK
ncbi:MAG: nucleotide exchange factor GrpE [Elusimicrobiales bacterium]|nr:nucleotide exchange factor GrpE [Elusimicrobiales bacterium]MCK5357264.1 nucleotide exchange factor GrpE [Elusimicrobiales bacterium]